jgi:hypothetical protein
MALTTPQRTFCLVGVRIGVKRGVMEPKGPILSTGKAPIGVRLGVSLALSARERPDSEHESGLRSVEWYRISDSW